ncbi:uncharacterized membrane-anchored protein YitT (DUF2179 family) [Balneicella halophila]|uniref:Uncharacterized membrane-anchored protein YitT (DUF2179 family) n=1 Tax=Balneicella halophila TaxID=1537566 RepID=A0A7L4UPX4_BALHA|nr:YitT family protein [Balneicella halophila]PVX51828.1 uncharacterized membrane-anchored protein YitT (DUF2179 family) [Balneicella halophila]
MKSNNLFTEIKDYVVITLSLLLYTTGVIFFLIPAEVVGGGVTGIASLVYFYSGGTIPVAIPFVIINGVLVAIGMKLFGPKFGIKTVFAIVVTFVFLFVGQLFATPEIFQTLANTEPLLVAIIGGMCTGAGVGIAIAQGGSTGGTDIIALIANHYWNVPLGRTILYVDILIVSSSFFVVENPISVIYGFVALAMTAYFVDLVIEGRKQSVQFFIFTEKHEEMANRISEEIGRGVSLIDSYGWYTKKDKKIVMVLTRKVENRQIFRVVKEVDDKAFVSMNIVNGVYGNGFELIR